MKNRNPLLAFVLSFFVTGLGQIYNGQLKRGILLLILIIPIHLLLGFIGVGSFYGFALILSVLMLYKLYVSFDAYINAKKLNPYELRRINKLWIYVLFGLFSYAVMWYGPRLNRSIIGYHAHSIPTPSMEPTIKTGDRVMAIKIKPENVELGDIITFTREDGYSYLARVMGLPNQEIEIVNNKVIYKDGKEIMTQSGITKDEMFEYQEFQSELPNGRTFMTQKTIKVRGQDFRTPQFANMEKRTIPKGHIFVLGDNRDNSEDSRMYGTIPIENVDKEIRYVWWGKSMERVGVNLELK